MTRLRPRAAAPAAAALAALAACADHVPADRLTAVGAPAPRAAAAPAAAPAPDSAAASFAWLAPTVTAPAPAPAPADTFDAPALARLAVEVCAAGDGGACAGAPAARYTAATAPYAQQVRADTVRQAFLVYWATGAAPAGRYRARVLDGAREVGALDVRVGATAADLAGVDRAATGVVLRGGQLALRFRVGRRGAAPADPPPADTASAAALRLAAEQLYAVADSGADVTPGVRALLDRLLPVLGASRQGEVAARLAAGRPVAFDFQAALVGRAFGAGARTSLAGFAAAAAGAGAATQTGGTPLTLAALTDALRPLVGRASYTAEEVVPALVLALGQARARRAGAAVDPVWGDAQLDALQTLLLMYSLQHAGLDAGPAPAPGAPQPASAAPAGPRVWLGAALPDLRRDSLVQFRAWVDGRIGRAVQMPTSRADAPRTSACNAIRLDGIGFTVAADKPQLGRIDIGLPFGTQVTAALTYGYAPDAFGRAVLAAARCTLPAAGPVAGAPVTWTVTGDLRAQGGLTVQDAATGARGTALAYFEAFREVVPPALRGLAQDAAGTVDVRTSGLVPGWGALDRAVGARDSAAGGAPLRVRYYTWPRALKLDYQIALAGTAFTPGVTNDLAVRGTLTLPRRAHDGVVEYHAEAPFAYTRSLVRGTAGRCTYQETGTENGTLGFAVIADGGRTGRPFSATPYATASWGVERFDITCPGPLVVRDKWSGFGVMLTSVYAPVAPGPFRAQSARPLVDWQPVELGVLRAAVSRTVPGPLAPLTERSTYTLRLVP